MNQTNMIVMRDSSDEVSFYFVTDACFSKLQNKFNSLKTNQDNEDLMELTYQELNIASNLTHPMQFMQTFCLESVNFPPVKNLLVLPEF